MGEFGKTVEERDALLDQGRCPACEGNLVPVDEDLQGCSGLSVPAARLSDDFKKDESLADCGRVSPRLITAARSPVWKY